MCKRFNSNTKNMMICNSLLSKKVGNTPIHSRLKSFSFYYVRTYHEVPGIEYFPVAINDRIDRISNEIQMMYNSDVIKFQCP